MPATGTFQVNATFDKSQIDQGFTDSAKSAQQWKEKLDVTFSEAATSSQRSFRAISDEAKLSAANVSAAQVRGAETARELNAAYAEQAAALKLSKGPMGETAEVTSLLAATQARATAAAHAHAAAMKELAGASHAAVTDVQATSAAIRSLEGNAGLRAVENFIARTLGLGPAMGAIFPLVGAFAFGKILFDMGDKVYEVEQKATHAGTAIALAFADMHDKAQVTNDDLAIQNDKLQDEIDKLSGHPNNGLQTALDEARKMADKLLDSLQGDRKELEALLKEHNVGVFGSMLSGVAGTGTQGKELTADQQALTKSVRDAQSEFERTVAGDPSNLKAATEARNHAVSAAYESQIATLHTESARLKKEQTDREADAAAVAASGAEATALPAIDNSAKISNVEGRAQQLQDQLAREKLNASIGDREQTVGKLKQDKAGDKGDDSAAKEQLKAIEEQFAELNAAKANITGHPLTAGDALNFWAGYLDTFKARSEEAKKVLEEVAKYQDGVHHKIQEAAAKIKAETTKIDEEGIRVLPKGNEAAEKMLKEQNEDLLRAGARWDGYWASVARGQETAARIAEDLALTNVKLAEENGSLTRVGAAQLVATLHANEHRAALVALRAELERLEKEATRDSLTGAVTDPKQAGKIEGVKNQIAQETGKGQQQAGQDQKAVADAMAAPYLKALTTVESGWNSAQRSMLSGQKSLAQAMRSMWSGVALDAIQNIEKIGFNWAKHQLLMVAQKAATTTANATADATGAAVATATSGQSAIKQLAHSAAVAAGKAWSAFADIPIVGPELGAVAAGATYAGVMALAAFEQGTMYVPHAGAAMLHPGEAVLGSPSAQVMRDAMSGKLAGGGGGGDVNLHLGGNTFHGDSGGGFAQQLSRHEDHLVGMITSLNRRGKLRLAR